MLYVLNPTSSGHREKETYVLLCKECDTCPIRFRCLTEREEIEMSGSDFLALRSILIHSSEFIRMNMEECIEYKYLKDLSVGLLNMWELLLMKNRIK